MGITISIYWASSNCALFISVMQLINGAQSLNITFLLVSFTGAAVTAKFGPFIVPLTCLYASHYNHINLTLYLTF